LTLNKILESKLEKNGIITTKQAASLGIKRHILSNLAKKGELVRIKKVVYKKNNQLIDEYSIIQSDNDKVIFSYQTALYFHDLSDRTPNIIQITVPQGYNVLHLTNNFQNLKFHYVDKVVFDMGVILVPSNVGNPIRVYNKERCICDLVKGRKHIDKEFFLNAVTKYFLSKDRNTRKLVKYSRKLGVKKDIRTYLEVVG